MADADIRPMSLGEVLDRTFHLYKNHFWLFAGITALPFSLLLIAQVAVAAMSSIAAKAPLAHTPPFSPGAVGGMVGGGALVMILYFVMIGAAHAATVFAVSDLYLSRPVSIRGSFTQVGWKVFRVLAVFLLLGLILVVGFVVIAVFGFALPGAVLKGIGLLLLIPVVGILMVILMCRVAVSIPAAMLEDLGAVRALERSVNLTKGHVLQIFVIFLLVLVATYVAVLVLQMPLLILMMASVTAHKTPSFGLQVLQQLAAFVSQVLVGPIGTIAFSLMYYNLRVRKEAFDIQHLMASMSANPEPNAPSAA
jgi:Membrane domain of glycerophosphoryl diester phosphodiesterase